MDLLKLVKLRLNITTAYEDNKLIDIIEDGQMFLEDRVGPINWTSDKSSARLLKEYCRYAWNGSIAYFEENFRSDILNLQLKKAMESRWDDEV